MRPTPTSIEADLHSRDAARVASALAELDHAWRRRPATPMPMPDAHALADTFPGGVPDDVVKQFIKVVYHYPAFDPPPDPGGRHTEALEAARLVGPGQLVYEVAVWIRGDHDAEFAVKRVMRHLLRFPADGEADLAVVDQLLDHLLDARATHAAVVDGLADWAFVDAYRDLVSEIYERLNHDERARIDAARGT